MPIIDILGNTPLCYALSYRFDDFEKAASILLRYGANPNYRLQYDSILFEYVLYLHDEPENWNVIDLPGICKQSKHFSMFPLQRQISVLKIVQAICPSTYGIFKCSLVSLAD